MAKKRKQASRRQTRATSHSPEVVTWALQGIQQAIHATRAKLADLEAQARQLRSTTRSAAAAAAESMASGTGEVPPVPTKPARKKRKLSADARRRIAEAQKRRWAKVKSKDKATSS